MKIYEEKDMEKKKERDTDKQEKLLDAIGKIDEDLIADAVLDKGQKKRNSWIPWGIAVAACLALVIFVGAKFILKDAWEDGAESLPTENIAAGEHRPDQTTPGSALPEAGTEERTITERETLESSEDVGQEPEEEWEILEPDSPEDLPLLAVGEFLNEGMGYEGFMAHDIQELTDANPWREDMNLPALPVYENALTYDDHYWKASGADFEAMKEFLFTVADRLGLDRETLTIGDNTPDEEEQEIIREKLDGEITEGYFEPTAVTAEADGIQIEVDQQMRTYIYFEPNVLLPKQYHFTYESTYEELASVADYLQDQYSTLIHMEKPQVEIGYGDYTYAGEQNFHHLAFFDMAGGSVERILHYNFNRIEFNCSEDGKLSSIWISQTNFSRKVGNYPIISAEEAKGLLLNGNYLTSVPYEAPGEEYIRKVELVYRNGIYEKYYMPYYRFYIELPEEKREHGLKSYGAYYVPAVKGEYLSDMPTWDGRFN
ncbi:MAG: hypothetical protein HFI63_05790 [Lachnospiraceae bacterium]|nr:hypothetical protein [Lachnospiraceae bacterium]